MMRLYQRLYQLLSANSGKLATDSSLPIQVNVVEGWYLQFHIMTEHLAFGCSFQ